MDTKAILAEVKSNIAKLDGCVGPHDFSVPHCMLGQVVTDWSCSKCGGHVSAHNRRWYGRGLIHGRASASRAEE